MSGGYDATRIEPECQRRWAAARPFAAVREPGRAKRYVYNPAPYLTGSLHLGHVRNYCYGDFAARLARLHGENVLYTIGFDAFGLPTEMAAIRNRCAPAEWSARCHQAMVAQLRRLGLSIDWDRSFITSDPGYYRWTQWIFLALLEEGLIHATEATNGWCAGCEAALARSQIVDGCCWHCGQPVTTRRMREWRLSIAPYLDELLKGLDGMNDLNGLAAEEQRLLIGRQSGFAVDLEIRPGGGRVTAFMSDPGTWFRECELLIDRRDEATLALLGDAGAVAFEPATGREFPIRVVSARDPTFSDQPRLAPSGDGAGAGGIASPALRPMNVYRQKDFSISRARFWGTPIPVVRCGSCGDVPLRPEDLPVIAPAVIFDAAVGALRHEDPEWARRACPRCGEPAALESQVMDCHMDSIWHYFRPCARRDDATFLFDPDEVEYWMPVDAIHFGRDVIPFMLDLRFFTRFLRRRGLVPFGEFCRDVLAHGLVLHQGRKMSKHLGNTVLPGELVERFGADSLRFHLLAQADPRSDCDWSEDGIRRHHQLLASYHAMLTEWTGRPAGAGEMDRAWEPGPAREQREGFSRYTRVFLDKVARQEELLDRAAAATRFDRYATSLRHLLTDMVFFWTTHFQREHDPRFAGLWPRIVRDSLLYLAPVAPHLAEEGWRMTGESGPMTRPVAVTAGRESA